MKKINYWRFLTFLFFNAFATVAIANFGTITVSGAGGNYAYPLDADCSTKLVVEIYLANLDLYPSNAGVTGNDYPLPTEVPNMYITYDVPGLITSLPIDITSYLFTYVYKQNGNNVYKMELGIPINDFTDECTEIIGQILEYSYTISLLTDNNGTSPLEFYPVCDNLDPTEIFSCTAFSYTAPYCIAGSSCTNEDLAKIDEVLYLDCNYCASGGGGAGRISIDEGKDKINEERVKIREGKESSLAMTNSELSVFPNPAESQLTILWTGESKVKRFDIYSVNGKLLKGWYNTLDDDYVKKTVDISFLPKGIYLLKAITEEGNKMAKIVKQ